LLNFGIDLRSTSIGVFALSGVRSVLAELWKSGTVIQLARRRFIRAGMMITSSPAKAARPPTTYQLVPPGSDWMSGISGSGDGGVSGAF
jgi:hypothetical protein